MSADILAIDGTAVAIGDAAVLLTGPSGSGKSDLALRLIDGGAQLIADDRVELIVDRGKLCCRAPHDMPPALQGFIEARGVGILPAPQIAGPLPVQWLVELVPPGFDSADRVERLPAAESKTFLGHAVPLLRLSAFEASTPAKLRLAVAAGPGLIMGRE